MRLAVCAAFVALTGCGDDGNGDSCTAPVDPSFDNGTCGADVQVTGELVDWDNDETFCGINGAMVSAGGESASTAPNGRFILCAPDSAETTLAITLPTAMSQCTVPSSVYPIPTQLYVNSDTIKSGATISARSMTSIRRDSFFADVIGETFQPTRAHLLVHVDGEPVALSIDNAHGPTAAITGTTWALGDTGHDVFFPNVEVGDGSATISVASGCATATTVPLTAGTITNVTILTY